MNSYHYSLHLKKQEDDNRDARVFTLHYYYGYALLLHAYGIWQVVAVLFYHNTSNARMSRSVATQ